MGMGRELEGLELVETFTYLESLLIGGAANGREVPEVEDKQVAKAVYLSTSAGLTTYLGGKISEAYHSLFDNTTTIKPNVSDSSSNAGDSTGEKKLAEDGPLQDLKILPTKVKEGNPL